MAIACDKCGVKTEIPEAFFKQRKSFRTGLRTECPRCYSEAQLSGQRKSLWWSLAMGAFGLAVALTLPERKSGWMLLNLFFFELFLIASILPHELGHALVARRLGMKVFKVYMGQGKTLFTRNLFGFHTEFRAIPLGGLTLAAPTDVNWFRWKQFAFIFAGPFANFLLCGIVLLFVPLREWWDFEKVSSGVAVGHAFLYANLIILVQNLWPHTFNSPVGKLASDGKQLWQTLFTKRDTINNLMAVRFVFEAMDYHEKQRPEAALDWVEQGLARYPENLLLLNWRGLLLIECQHYEAARDCFTKLLVREGNPPAVRGLMLNNVAYVDALLGGTARLAEADIFSQEAMSLLGWVPAVKGTRGTTLLELGRIDEAVLLLRESMEQADNPSNKAQNACFISIGETRRGNLVESRKYLDEARQLAPACFLLERAERLLKEATA